MVKDEIFDHFSDMVSGKGQFYQIVFDRTIYIGKVKPKYHQVFPILLWLSDPLRYNTRFIPVCREHLSPAIKFYLRVLQQKSCEVIHNYLQ